LNNLASLIHEFAVPRHLTASSTTRSRRDDARFRVDGVADVDRLLELPIFDPEEGNGVNVRSVRTKSGEIGESEEPVSNWSTERTPCRRFVIDVQRIEITGQTGKVNDVSFGDGASLAFPAVTNLQFFEMQSLHREFLSVTERAGRDCLDIQEFRQDRTPERFAAIIGTSFLFKYAVRKFLPR
jgi:hypothetical protein